MDEVQTLNNNQIKKFILRIDIDKTKDINFDDIKEELKGDYQALKTEIHEHINLSIDEEKQKAEVTSYKFKKYVLSTTDGVFLKLSNFDKNIIIETSSYRDSSIYEKRILRVIELIKSEFGLDLSSSRIGMRFVNNFPCDKVQDIARYFQTRQAKIIKEGLKEVNTTRVVMVNETREDDAHLARVQYGVPNRFYPSLISKPELMLDIDVYSMGLQSIDDWENLIRTANHIAYRLFEGYVNDTYIKSLK